MFSSRLRPQPVVIDHHESVVALGVQAMLEQARYPAAITVVDDAFRPHPDALDAHLVITDLETARCSPRARQRDGSARALGRLVVVVRATEADCRAAVKAGADGLLLRAFKASELVEAIEVVSRGAPYRSPRAAVLLANDSPADALTVRELEVVQYLVGGHAYKEIARELGIALSTVKAHMKSIFAKLRASNRVHVSCIASERGIVPKRRMIPPERSPQAWSLPNETIV